MFEAFSDALYTGTCDLHGRDNSGLRWPPRHKQNAASIINHVTWYSDWLYNKSEKYAQQHDLPLKTVLLNPKRKASRAEYLSNLAAYHHRKNRAFLSYAFDDKAARSQAEYSRTIHTKNTTPLFRTEPAKAFPEQFFWELLQAFTIPGSKQTDPIFKRLNLKNCLITLLMHYGARRVSEPFHLYINDIMEDPEKKGSALVKLHHYESGKPPQLDHRSKQCTNRRDYLKQVFGRLPRKDSACSKSYYCGWKNPVVNKECYLVVNWFYPNAGELFWKLWRLYLQHQYVSGDHPFAFTNKNGEPASYHKFIEAHARAVRRIGLDPRKDSGTTAHGHRHAYGHRARAAGIDPITLQRMMDHSSIESQRTYTVPTGEEIRKELKERADGLHLTPAQTTTQKFTGKGRGQDPLLMGFSDVDPLELLSGRYPQLAQGS